MVDAPSLADDEVGLAVRAYAEADRAFVDSVAAGRPPQPGLDVALQAHLLVDAAYRSAAGGGVPIGVAAPRAETRISMHIVGTLPLGAHD